jgi:hypothetical protein
MPEYILSQDRLGRLARIPLEWRGQWSSPRSREDRYSYPSGTDRGFFPADIVRLLAWPFAQVPQDIKGPSWSWRAVAPE